jgi:hypothetical protein
MKPGQKVILWRMNGEWQVWDHTGMTPEEMQRDFEMLARNKTVEVLWLTVDDSWSHGVQVKP